MKLDEDKMSGIEKMVDEYFTLEEKIMSEIEKLPNNGKSCDCSESERFCIVDDNNIVCKCYNCGGDIEW